MSALGLGASGSSLPRAVSIWTDRSPQQSSSCSASWHYPLECFRSCLLIEVAVGYQGDMGIEFHEIGFATVDVGRNGAARADGYRLCREALAGHFIVLSH